MARTDQLSGFVQSATYMTKKVGHLHDCIDASTL